VFSGGWSYNPIASPFGRRTLAAFLRFGRVPVFQ
jgi:hypothetical protein